MPLLRRDTPEGPVWVRPPYRPEDYSVPPEALRLFERWRGRDDVEGTEELLALRDGPFGNYIQVDRQIRGGKTWITPGLLIARGNVAREVLIPDMTGFRDWNFTAGGDDILGRRLRDGFDIGAATAVNDPSSMNDVVWSLCTRVDAREDLEILRGCWSTTLDPTSYPEEERRLNSRVVIDACKPWVRRDTFPKVARSSRSLDARVRAKFANALRGY